MFATHNKAAQKATPRVSTVSGRPSVVLMILTSAFWGTLGARCADWSRVTNVRADVQGSAASVWRVKEATIEEVFNATWGNLNVKNISGKRQPPPALYAEYYDSQGRRCFSLPFSGWQNTDEKTGDFLPGEMRTLVAMTSYVSPAVQVKELKLYQVKRHGSSVTGDSGTIRAVSSAPLAIEPVSISPDLEWQRMWLESELINSEKPLVDLVLARLLVSAEGKVAGVGISNSASETATLWFRGFVTHLAFHFLGGVNAPRSRQVLVLVRALTSPGDLNLSPFAPRDSSWVRDYASRITGDELPPVETLILEPSSRENYLQHGVGYFRYEGAGSSWTPEIGQTDPPPPDARVHFINQHR